MFPVGEGAERGREAWAAKAGGGGVRISRSCQEIRGGGDIPPQFFYNSASFFLTRFKLGHLNKLLHCAKYDADLTAKTLCEI